jgi:excisionase family DNA binding protein
MAGKFLPLDEAARHLGVTADEIHRLVDRKRLFPLRDGTTVKFKIDELDRLAAAGIEDEAPSGLSLELELADEEPAPAAGTINLELGGVETATPANAAAPADEISLADSVALPAGSVDSGTRLQVEADSLVLGGSGSLAGDLPIEVKTGGDSDAIPTIFADDALSGNDLAMPTLATGNAIGLGAMELDLDSIVGLSAPGSAQPAPVAKPAPVASPDDSGTLAIDLSDLGGGSRVSRAGGSNAAGSLVFGSDVDPAGISGSIADAGAALSGALDSGLSLEDGDAAVSGIDLGPLDDGGLADGGATALAGEEFDLGGLGDDEESASVVAVEPESGDSSFFATGEGESSEFTGDIPLSAEAAPDVGDLVTAAAVPDTRFNVWQIAGLVCCSLLLLAGGFVMFDLMRTIGSPADLSLSSPLLNPLSSVFGWR